MAEPNAAGEAATAEKLPADVGDLLVNNGAPDGKTTEAEPEAKEPKDERYEELLTQLRRQSDMIARRDRDLGDVGERVKKQDQMLAELVENQRNANVRGYGRAEAEVRAAMKRAVAEADTASYDRLEVELVELQKLRPSLKAAEKSATADPPPGTGQPSPAVGQWLRDNAWFGAPGNARMTFAAQGAEIDIKAEFPHLSEAERLMKVREQMEKDFPDKFENKARKTAAVVAQPSAQAARKVADPKKKTVNDLPHDVRQTLAKLQRMNPKLTNEQYVADYFKDDKA